MILDMMLMPLNGFWKDVGPGVSLLGQKSKLSERYSVEQCNNSRSREERFSAGTTTPMFGRRLKSCLQV